MKRMRVFALDLPLYYKSSHEAMASNLLSSKQINERISTLYSICDKHFKNTKYYKLKLACLNVSFLVQYGVFYAYPYLRLSPFCYRELMVFISYVKFFIKHKFNYNSFKKQSLEFMPIIS